MQINLPSFSSRKYLYISIALLFLIFLIIVSYLSFSPKSQIPKPSEHPADIISTAPVNVNQNTISISKQYSQDNDASMKGKFTPSQPIAKVGDEIIYGKDINFILYIKFPYDLTSASATLYYLKNKILPVAVEDSVILQTEKKKNPKSIGSDIFNNPDKNESLRFKKVQEITNRLKTQEEEVSGEMVSIWFHNVSMPSIPLPQAENIARDKITAIYNQLKNGTITMTQAGNLIKNDPDLPKIDNSYKENAYYLFTARTKEEQSFSFPDLENALWKLSEGEMSPIIRHPDASIPLGSQSEEFYAVIKVNKINNKESGSFNEWLEKQKANYAVTIY